MKHHPILLSLLFGLVSASGSITRQCYIGEPPLCNNSLAADKNCRGVFDNTLNGYKRMDCDYVIYDIPTTQRNTSKWILIHSGGCDSNTGYMGDYFSQDMGLNLFGLRTCAGFEESLCANLHDYSACDATHVSFFGSPPNATYAPHGQGLNIPALEDIYFNKNVNMLLFHQYGFSNVSYPWWGAAGCNNSTTPIYMCIAGADPNYKTKFDAIKTLLEKELGSTYWLPCRLEVIDASPFSADLNASVPCSGIYEGTYMDPAKFGAVVYPNAAPVWQWEMTGIQNKAITYATQLDPESSFVNAFRTAVNIALCKTFSSNQTECLDDDMLIGN